MEAEAEAEAVEAALKSTASKSLLLSLDDIYWVLYYVYNTCKYWAYPVPTRDVGAVDLNAASTASASASASILEFKY